MIQPLLGRTNQVWPAKWLRLQPPVESEELPHFLNAALASQVPIDVSVQPALFGGQIRGSQYTSVSRSRLDYALASNHDHAVHLVQAHLIETLSAIGRERIDFYFLRVKNVVEEFQIAGALEALEMARQELHIQFVGIACDGPPLATLNVWQFHDAFDVVLISDQASYDTLAPLARERRVGIITDGDWSEDNESPSIRSVSSIEDIERVLA